MVTETPVRKDPPSTKSGRPLGAQSGLWVEKLKPLKTKRRAGKWHQVAEMESQQQAADAARNIRTGRVRRPEGIWEARSSTEDGKFYVYAKYMGNPDG